MNKTRSPATPPAPAKPAKKKPVRAPASAPVGAKKAALPPKAAKPAPAPAPAPLKVKHKLVRDSFTIPKSEYEVLQGLKVRAANLKRPIKKSELLRAGIGALSGMTDKAFLLALATVPSLKTGRPKATE